MRKSMTPPLTPDAYDDEKNDDNDAMLDEKPTDENETNDDNTAEENADATAVDITIEENADEKVGETNTAGVI